MAAVESAGPRLTGKRVVIDPGHGGDDPGVAEGSITEADLTWDLATRLEGRLQAVGVTALLTRGPSTTASDQERQPSPMTPGRPVVSLHVDADASPRANASLPITTAPRSRRRGSASGWRTSPNERSWPGPDC